MAISNQQTYPHEQTAHENNPSVESHDLSSPAFSKPSGLFIPISKYTKALIKGWKTPPVQHSQSVVKISVSQTVSFAAFLYEKMRNAVEFREEHLIRRAAIERIIKRRLFLNENGRNLAEPLLKELLWARYYENNTLGEEKIAEIQSIIDKYFFLKNELIQGRPQSEQNNISEFILEILSCEIEESLSPVHQKESITNYDYQILRPYIEPFDGEEERDIQVYIAVEKTLAHSDKALIRYHLLKLFIPGITQINWQTADRILPDFYNAYRKIEKDLNHKYAEKVRNAVKKQIPPFLILRDIFQSSNISIADSLSSENKLKYKVDEACRKRYDESRGRLLRTAVRSFIYILLTKV